MLVINTIAPIALVILLGAILRRSRFAPESLFLQTNRLVFWIGIQVPPGPSVGSVVWHVAFGVAALPLTLLVTGFTHARMDTPARAIVVTNPSPNRFVLAQPPPPRRAARRRSSSNAPTARSAPTSKARARSAARASSCRAHRGPAAPTSD